MGFEEDVRSAINRNSVENGSDTPDFMLARFILRVVDSFNEVVKDREAWHGRAAAPAPLNDPLLTRGRKAADAIYAAVPSEVAQDISELLSELCDEVVRLRRGDCSAGHMHVFGLDDEGTWHQPCRIAVERYLLEKKE